MMSVGSAPRPWPHAALALAAALLTTGCPSKEKPRKDGAEVTTNAPGAFSAKKGEVKADMDAGPPPPICEVVEEKVWGKWTNLRTGITVTRMRDRRIQLGVAFGYRPHVLSFDAKGGGSLRRVPQRSGVTLRKKIDGRKDLQRVTPAANVEGVEAYVDYRFKYKDKHRRIYCGEAGKDDPTLLFDGMPQLERIEQAAKPVQQLPEEDAGAPPDGGKVPDVVDPALLRARSREKLVELRDCRSFVSARDGAMWAVGSELQGKRSGGEVEWKMVFFTWENGKRNTLFTSNLGKEPKKLYTLEAPIAERMDDGGFLMTARYKGGMYSFLLDENKKLKDKRRYVAGWPSLPRKAQDGKSMRLLTSLRKSKTEWKLAGLVLKPDAPELPRNLASIEVVEGESEAEPTFARLGDQRWMAYHVGSRRKGKMVLSPVDETLHESGERFQISEDDLEIYESLIFDTEDDHLLAVYIRHGGESKAELVSKKLKCRVQKK